MTYQVPQVCKLLGRIFLDNNHFKFYQNLLSDF